MSMLCLERVWLQCHVVFVVSVWLQGHFLFWFGWINRFSLKFQVFSLGSLCMTLRFNFGSRAMNTGSNISCTLQFQTFHCFNITISLFQYTDTHVGANNIQKTAIKFTCHNIVLIRLVNYNFNFNVMGKFCNFN